MKKQDLEKLKKKLLEEKDKVIQAKSKKSGEEKSNTQTGDEGDKASAEIELDAMYQEEQRGHILLKNINDALAKIEDGTYGECENCGEDIAVERLMANPYAKLCVDCKSAEELREKKFAKSSNGPSNSFDDGE